MQPENRKTKRPIKVQERPTTVQERPIKVQERPTTVQINFRENRETTTAQDFEARSKNPDFHLLMLINNN